MRDAVGNVESVLLIGGTSEIGLAIAHRLVRERGARRVVLAGRDEAGLARAADDLRRAGATDVASVRLDVTDPPTDHEKVADAIFERHGDLDVVVYAVGVLGRQQRAEVDANHAVDVVTATYTGAVSVLTPVARALERQGHGAILVLSSIAGVRARRANYVYGSAKAGLDAFAQGLGDRLHEAGIPVVVVRPGFVHTRMTQGREPAPFATTPDVVAEAAVGALDRGALTAHAPRPLSAVARVFRALPRPIWRRLPG